jgi:hypothetical protein
MHLLQDSTFKTLSQSPTYFIFLELLWNSFVTM